MNNNKIMTQYSKETAYKFLRSKIKQIERVERKWEKEEDSVIMTKCKPTLPQDQILITGKIVRCTYLYFNRRILLSHEIHIENFPKKIENCILERCIWNIKQIKKFKVKYNSEFTFKQIRYFNLISNTLKKYLYLHHYKDTIIAITLRRKFHGQEGVCRLIQSYL